MRCGAIDSAGLALAIGLLGCGTPDNPPPPSQAFVPKPAPHIPHPDPPAPMPHVQQPPPPPPPPPPLVLSTDCVRIGTVTAMEVRGANLLACIDVNGDGNPDQCVEWNRSSGRVTKIQPILTVVNPPSPATDDKPDADAGDERVIQDTSSIEVCAEDRVCVKLMPRLGDGATIENVRADVAHHNIAVTIADGDNANGRVEFWDVAAGRMRTRVKIGAVEPDFGYSFAGKAFGDGFVSISTRSDNSLSTATLFGFDGSRRAALAGGSHFVEADQMLLLAPGQLAVFDQGVPDHPYGVYVHSLGSGGVVAKFTVQTDNDGDDDAILMKIDRTTLGVVQWSNELRIDLLDTRTGGDKTLKAPGC